MIRRIYPISTFSVRFGDSVWEERGTSLPGFKNSLESGEILLIGSSHRGRQHGRSHLAETSRLALISQRHDGAASRRVSPRIRGLHGEGSFGGAHHEPLVRNDMAHHVGVGDAPAEEARRYLERADLMLFTAQGEGMALAAM